MYITHTGSRTFSRQAMGCCGQRVSLRRAILKTDTDLLCSELAIKIVNVDDMTRVRYIRDLAKPIKHVTFDFNGEYLMTSCTDGSIHVYDTMSEEPQLLRKVEGLIPRVEPDVQTSSAVVWHPDGRAFAAPTATKGSWPKCLCSSPSEELTRRIRCPGNVEAGLGEAESLFGWPHERGNCCCLVAKRCIACHGWA